MIANVVDTNVAIAANGRNTHAELACQLECVKTLEDVCARQIVALDDGNRIFEEYKEHLSFAGIPGVGDKFFKYVFDHMYGGNRVHLVSITPCDDGSRGFDELPTNSLDKSDRKFLATAVAAKADGLNATILNATDSDWNEQQDLTSKLGVTVRQLCPQHASRNSRVADGRGVTRC